MKARVVIGAVAAVLIAIAVYWLTRRGDAPATPARPEATHVSASRVKHSEAERKALLAAIAIARSQRTSAPAKTSSPSSTSTSPTTGGPTPPPALPGTTLDIIDRTGDTSPWEQRALATVNQLFGECYDLGRAEDPKLEGTLTLQFTLSGEPSVGGLLERVEIVDDESSIKQATIRDCMTQQLYALELDPPPDGVRVERQISLKF